MLSRTAEYLLRNSTARFSLCHEHLVNRTPHSYARALFTSALSPVILTRFLRCCKVITKSRYNHNCSCAVKLASDNRGRKPKNYLFRKHFTVLTAQKKVDLFNQAPIISGNRLGTSTQIRFFTFHVFQQGICTNWRYVTIRSHNKPWNFGNAVSCCKWCSSINKLLW